MKVFVVFLTAVFIFSGCAVLKHSKFSERRIPWWVGYEDVVYASTDGTKIFAVGKGMAQDFNDAMRKSYKNAEDNFLYHMFSEIGTHATNLNFTLNGARIQDSYFESKDKTFIYYVLISLKKSAYEQNKRIISQQIMQFTKDLK